MYPEELRYSKEHEWIKVDGDRGTIGITDYAQQQLGDVVYVELPEVGAKYSAADVFGIIESVKAVSELFSPLSGEVVEVNEESGKVPQVITTHACNQLFRRDPLVSSLDHDRITMGIIGTHIDAMVPLHFLKSYPDIGLDVFHQMPYVNGAVGVG